ncbi:MAG TPA: hypothetical protein DD435_00095 [Cyanobacteria bacterium UBA8530]|nr:hypothetical protein [Cyanobacteria bacterium UBA8530]
MPSSLSFFGPDSYNGKMLFVATAKETRKIEAKLIEDWGMPQLLLMERAAIGVANLVSSQYPETPVVALVGPGNNGADAIAACRLLANRGYRVRVLLVSENKASETQLSWLRNYEVPVKRWSPAIEAKGVLLDGLFGFGLARAPEGVFAEAIAWANAQEADVVSIDLPSGILADTGVAPGSAISATHTVACGLLKVGLLCDPALSFVGKLWLADIGFPPFLLEKIRGRLLASPTLPQRSPSAYKGSMGSLLVVGGSRSYSGAVTMALRSAVKSGAGLVYGAVPGSIRETVAVAVPEAVVLGLEETPEGFIDPSSFEALLPILEACRAVLIGPGLGRSEASAELTKKFWFGSPIPMVLDAEALIPQLARLERRAPAILTPHPGEAGRLLGLEAAVIQGDRRRAALSISERFRSVAVLKGGRSLVAEGPNFRVLAETSPLLATAGSGDVLAGLMGGLLAQSFPPFEAASLAVSLQGKMGWLAQREGRRSLSALEVLDYFDRALSFTPLPPGRPERIY